LIDPERLKALELAVIFATGRNIEDQNQLFFLADEFLGYVESRAQAADAQSDYPRIQVP
jgi:hypothetical protein